MEMTAPDIRHLDGGKPSQKLARAVFPILVRQARINQPLSYKDLAQEIGSDPIAMRFPLGIIGRAIEDLTKKWKRRIPPIQAFVVSKRDGVPSEGIAKFTRRPSEYLAADLARKQDIAGNLQSEAHRFDDWGKVLDYFKLPHPGPVGFSESGLVLDGTGGPGVLYESERHDQLKRYIAEQPSVLGLRKSLAPGVTEFSFPTGDAIDVVFGDAGSQYIGVEVKSSVSSEGDIARGFLQCVKYEALLKGAAAIKGLRTTVRVILALEGRLPLGLQSMRNALGIAVKEEIAEHSK